MSKDYFTNILLEYSNKYTNIFTYVPLEDEVSTFEFIKKLLKKKKKVIVPKCVKGEIIPIQIKSIDDLKKGTYNILEPKNNLEFDKNNIEIFFIPGTKFDKLNNRKGRGKGYFDKFLADVKEKPIIGLCYKNQIIEKLETNPWDIPMTKVLVKK